MFKLISGAVVCGFALYGLVTYVERKKSKAVANLADTAQVADTEGPGAATAGEWVSSLSMTTMGRV